MIATIRPSTTGSNATYWISSEPADGGGTGSWVHVVPLSSLRCIASPKCVSIRSWLPSRGFTTTVRAGEAVGRAKAVQVRPPSVLRAEGADTFDATKEPLAPTWRSDTEAARG